MLQQPKPSYSSPSLKETLISAGKPLAESQIDRAKEEDYGEF